MLAKEGNQVLFITPPISPFHDKKEHKIRFEQSQKGLYQAFDNYFVFTPFTFVPPIKKLPLFFFFIINIWVYLCKNKLITVLRQQDFLDVDILIIDYFAFLPLLKIIKSRKIIVRVTDNLKGFGVGKAALNAEQELLKNANKVIYTSLFLKEYVSKYNQNCLYIPNGVDFDKFQGEFKKPKFFNEVKNPVAVYVGAIETWFDFDLLEYLSENLVDIHFLIIGPLNYKPISLKRLSHANNITFYGAVKNDIIPNYLKYSSVGIIPFKNDMELVQSISPLKLYEYMAAGLPVVSTAWKELITLNSPAFLAESEEEFSQYIKKVLIRYDSKDSLDFAKENTWSNRLLKML